jgi:hypothetical protein
MPDRVRLRLTTAENAAINRRRRTRRSTSRARSSRCAATVSRSLVAPAAHLRPGNYRRPSGSCSAPGARAGPPQVPTGQLVPERPDTAGQRAGHRRSVGAMWRRVDRGEASQWYFKVTDYAHRPVDALEQLTDTWRAGCSRCSATGSSVRGRPQPLRRAPARRLATTADRLHDAPDTVQGATFMVPHRPTRHPRRPGRSVRRVIVRPPAGQHRCRLTLPIAAGPTRNAVSAM